MAKNEAKIKFTAETGEYNQAIKSANDEMAKLRAELKLNETQMKTTGSSVEALKTQHGLLETQLSAAESKTEALNAKVQKAAEIFGENATETTKLKTQLANAQAAEEKIRQAIANCNDALERQAQEEKDAGSATAQLTDKIDKQKDELVRLKKEYVDAALEYGENSTEAKKLAKEIKNLSGDLKKNQTELGKAANKADDLDQSFDDAGDAARDSSEGFTVAKGVIADLASEAIQAAINKLKEFIGWLMELPEATREIRQDMATLETSFEKSNFTTEQATNTWKELYKIFGEDDRAVEAANLISKMAKNQEDLNAWVTITKGVWGQYQDSLPVEGLAEASNETAKTGKVTGVLADALNWSGDAAKMFSKYMSEDVTTAEDAFNEALAECSNEQERQALITETLTSLYGDSAKAYEEASGTQIAAKDATAENILLQNELADTMEPLTTAYQGLKNELLAQFIPVIKTVATFLAEHPGMLKAIVVALTVMSAAIGTIAIAWAVYTAAQWAANTAIYACPIGWIIAAIVALIAVIVMIVVYWNDLKEAAVGCWESIKSAWGTAVGFFKGVWSGIKGAFSNAKTWFVEKFTQAKQGVQNAWSGITNFFSKIYTKIKNTFAKVKDAILSPFRKAVDKVKEIFNKLKLSFPHIKLPHFSVKPKGWKIGDLLKGSIPKLAIEWYAKGAIFTKPTIFNTPYGLKGVGEKGKEAVLPIDRLQGYISDAITRNTQATSYDDTLAESIWDLANRPVVLNVNGKQFATATAYDTDSVNGMRNKLANLGIILD